MLLSLLYSKKSLKDRLWIVAFANTYDCVSTCQYIYACLPPSFPSSPVYMFRGSAGGGSTGLREKCHFLVLPTPFSPRQNSPHLGFFLPVGQSLDQCLPMPYHMRQMIAQRMNRQLGDFR